MSEPFQSLLVWLTIIAAGVVAILILHHQDILLIRGF
jgi:hypothetical protein